MIEPYLMAALGAVGRRIGYRFLSRNPVNADVKEAPDHCAKQEREDVEKELVRRGTYSAAPSENPRSYRLLPF